MRWAPVDAGLLLFLSLIQTCAFLAKWSRSNSLCVIGLCSELLLAVYVDVILLEAKLHSWPWFPDLAVPVARRFEHFQWNCRRDGLFSSPRFSVVLVLLRLVCRPACLSAAMCNSARRGHGSGRCTTPEVYRHVQHNPQFNRHVTNLP
jgi:hypothetical protein